MNILKSPVPKTHIRIFGLRLSELLSLVLTLAVFLALSNTYYAPKFFPDSEGYLQLADSVRDGSILEAPQHGNPPFVRGIRTPVYPLLLALGQKVVGGTGGYVLVIHTLLGMLTLVLVLWILKDVVPMPITGVALLLTFFEVCAPPGRSFFASTLTEWTAVCIVFLYFALIVHYFEQPKPFRFFLLCCVVSLGVLTRPAMISLIPMVAVIYFVSPRKLMNFLSGLIGCAPILFWMAINLHVLGSFALTTFDGVNLFGVAALIGHPDTQESDPTDLKDFIEKINANKIPKAGEEDESLERRLRFMADAGYNHNIYGLALKDPVISSYHPKRINELMRIYAVRTFLRYPNRYALYVWYGLLKCRGNTLLIVSGLLLAMTCFSFGLSGVGWAMTSVIVVHVLNIFLSSAVQMFTVRYLLVTLGPLEGALVLGAGALAFLRRTDSVPS